MAPAPERSFLYKLRRLRFEEVLILAEALALLTLAAPAVRRLRMATIGRLASRPIRRPLPLGDRRDYLVDTIGWAVFVAAKRSRLRALCFERGLTAQIMLRRRGIDSTLYYGIAPGKDKRLDAHVWVMDQGVGVTGAEIAETYATLACFPASGGPAGM